MKALKLDNIVLALLISLLLLFIGQPAIFDNQILHKIIKLRRDLKDQVHTHNIQILRYAFF